MAIKEIELVKPVTETRKVANMGLCFAVLNLATGYVVAAFAHRPDAEDFADDHGYGVREVAE